MRRILVLAVTAAALVAGCGDADDPAPTGADLTTVRCPLVATGEQENGVDRYAPAPDAFDTAELLDQRLADAEATAAKHGCTIVVSIADGKGQPVATDFDPKRIYVYTEDGVVTKVEGVGGGI